MSDISLAKSELTGRVYAVISPKRKQDVTAYVDYLINDATQKLQNEHADLKAKLAVAVEALGLACAFIDGVINMDNPDVTAETFKEVVLAEALDKFNDVAKIRSAYDALAKIKEAQ